MPKRIIVHWTGGTHRANSDDLQHYHFVIEGNGSIVKGRFDVVDNESTADTVYAAHTRLLNTGSIGIALAGMAGSRQTPFNIGPYPLTTTQFTELAKLCAELVTRYSLEVTPKTLLTHAEVSDVYPSAPQRGKWDITFHPSFGNRLVSAATVGTAIRESVLARLGQVPDPKADPSRHAFDLPVIGAAPAASVTENIMRLQQQVGAKPDGWIGQETYKKIAEYLNPKE